MTTPATATVSAESSQPETAAAAVAIDDKSTLAASSTHSDSGHGQSL